MNIKKKRRNKYKKRKNRKVKKVILRFGLIIVCFLIIIINICGYSVVGNLKYDIYYLKKELRQEEIRLDEFKSESRYKQFYKRNRRKSERRALIWIILRKPNQIYRSRELKNGGET